jgi:CPA1 family monovalent cation:H+ antiporter
MREESFVTVFDFAAILLVLAAGFSYLNRRLVRLPTTIGLMALTLLASLGAVAVGRFYPPIEQRAAAFVGQIDFSQTVLQGMLGFLLFAGALHINLDDLIREKVAIAVLATVGVVVSTLLVGGMTWGVLAVLGLPSTPIYCFLFGALISPTDPIAVLSMLQRLGAPGRLSVTIAGESLFNDGVGLVVFAALLGVAVGGRGFDPGSLALLFVRETAGGAAFGLIAGYLAYRLLKSVDDYQVEILLSLALVAGGTALAYALRLSAPIAMAFAGLLVGNQGRLFAMSPTTVERLDDFWELIDGVLNAVLFVLLGLAVLAVTFTGLTLRAGLLAVPAVLVARLASVGVSVWILRRAGRPVDRLPVPILTWGGLRGALPVAMALSLPREFGGSPVPERDVLLVMTYVVVVFSVLVQGLTIQSVVRRWLSRGERPARVKAG